MANRIIDSSPEIGLVVDARSMRETWRRRNVPMRILPELALLKCETLAEGPGLAAAKVEGLIDNSICEAYRERDLEGVPFGLGVDISGASKRFAPILITTWCTGLTLLTLVVLMRMPGYQKEQPMVHANLGGWVVSFLFPLFVIADLFRRFERESAVVSQALQVA